MNQKHLKEEKQTLELCLKNLRRLKKYYELQSRFRLRINEINLLMKGGEIK